MSDVSLEFTKRELEVMYALDHPNVIKCFEVYEDSRYIHVVMELCTGGDLLEHMIQNGLFSERDTAILIRKVCKAVNYLHSRNICHRDLKLENILFVSSTTGIDIKLADFGLARKFTKYLMHSYAGTLSYMAPEVLQGAYTQTCDVWSIGVMLYIMLTGKLPFDGESHEEVARMVLSREMVYNEKDWERVSPFALDLVRKMLTYDPEKRIALDRVLAHEWFQSNPSLYVLSRIPESILDKMRLYTAPKRLQHIAIKVAVKYLSVEDVQELKTAFQYIDTRNTGYISAEQFTEALNKTGLTSAVKYVKSNSYSEFMNTVDYLRLGEINFTEFLAATLDLKEVLNDDVLYAAFRHFDVENTGVIAVRDLAMAVHRTGVPLKSQEIEEIIGEIGLSEDSTITYEHFRSIIRKFYLVKGELPRVEQ